MTAQTRWEVSVLNVHNRRCKFMVIVSEGRVVLLPPPGEACIVPTRSVEPLCAAIQEADAVARQRGGHES